VNYTCMLLLISFSTVLELTVGNVCQIHAVRPLAIFLPVWG
jgi:hypothetical protein